jgi:hypothetical protein
MEFETEITCSTCKETMWESEFGFLVKARGKRHRQCKHCIRRQQQSRKRLCQLYRDNHLLGRYGITQADYDAMFARQGGRCAICGSDSNFVTIKRLDGKPANFAVDHDHDTGKVRGLLCHGCNQGLGKFKDSVELLRLAVAYLESHGDSRLFMTNGLKVG